MAVRVEMGKGLIPERRTFDVYKAYWPFVQLKNVRQR